MPEQEYLTVEHLSTKELTRIFSKIKVDPVSGCWNWIAGLSHYGYGFIWYRGRQEQAHRLMFSWLIHPLPRGWIARNEIQIDHVVCQNKRCCNPIHLEVVTLAENVRRSNNICGINFRKTHCVRGHQLPKTPNLQGARECKTCHNMTRRLNYWANHEERKQKAREQMRRSYYRKKLLFNPKP